MTSVVRVEDLSWTEYRRRLEEDAPAILLPVGSLEQHGPHLPLGTDAMIAEELSVRAAQRANALVLPALSYGYKSQPRSGGGNHFIGTTSLDGATLTHQVRDLLKELARHGARKVGIVNGHYDNEMFLIEGIDLALRELRADGVRDLKVVRLDYWNFTSKTTIARVFPDGRVNWALEHGAVAETSVMMHCNPAHVRLDLIPDGPAADFPPYDVYPTNTAIIPPTGVLSSAKAASAEKGALLVEEYVDGIAGALGAEFGAPRARLRAAAPAAR